MFGLLIVIAGISESSPSGCLVEEEGGIMLFCPGYSGKGYCCVAGGDSYCCGEEEWIKQAGTETTTESEPQLSQKELYENIVLKNRFRYEDINDQKDEKDQYNLNDIIEEEVKDVIDDIEEINESLDEIVELERDQSDQDNLNDIIEEEVKDVIDDLEEINDSLDEIVESERDRRRRLRNKVHTVNSWNEVYRVLLVSLIGLTLVLIISVLCNLFTRLCHISPKDMEYKDTEKTVLVQDRYQLVYSGMAQ